MQVLHFEIRIFSTCSACLFVDEELEFTNRNFSFVGEKAISVRSRRYILLYTCPLTLDTLIV